MPVKKTHPSFSLATSIGELGLQFDNETLVAVNFCKEKASRFSKVTLSQKTLATIKKIEAYFDKAQPLNNIPFQFNGTPFQQLVWQALSAIPFGQTLTYGGLAKQLGTSARAIGAACRSNPLPIVIPCHRIVAANGWGGFAGNSESMLKIKKWLITHEGNKNVKET